MARLKYVPVFEFDPNNPVRDIGDFNHTMASFTGVGNRDMYEDLKSGDVAVGDLAIAYQPHEAWQDDAEDSGWGFPCRIVKWVDCSETETSLLALVYLEIDPAYGIVDARGNANDTHDEEGYNYTYDNLPPAAFVTGAPELQPVEDPAD